MVHTRPRRILACSLDHASQLVRGETSSPGGSPEDVAGSAPDTVRVKGTRKYLSSDEKYRLLREYDAIIAQTGRTNHGEVAELCVRWGVGSNLPSELKRKMESTGTLMSKKRKSLPRKLTSPVKHKMKEIATNVNGDMTYPELRDQVYKETGVRMGVETVRKHVKKGNTS
eukprot:1183776-Prorocentrum_minimum.AAC.1